MSKYTNSHLYIVYIHLYVMCKEHKITKQKKLYYSTAGQVLVRDGYVSICLFYIFIGLKSDIKTL